MNLLFYHILIEQLPEKAAPYYFFVEIGSAQPALCPDTDPGTPVDYGPLRYDEKILSGNILKTYSVSFNAGVDSIYWATLFELFDPYNDNYKRCALIREDGLKKPAFYTYKLMKDKLNGFTSVVEVGEDIYRFSFQDRNPVFVSWTKHSDVSLRTIDLSGHVLSLNVKITHIVIELDLSDNPVYLADEIVPANMIIVPKTPVFIEEL